MRRMAINAEHLMDGYPTAKHLLQSAVKEAMPWAITLHTKGRTPSLDQLERLGTQILAIILASTPSTPPTDSPSTADVVGQAKIHAIGGRQ